MSDVIESLKRLAPAAIDRDELLVQTARASVRPLPIWKWLTMGLACSQLVTIGLWCTNRKPAEAIQATTPTLRVDTVTAPIVPEPNSYLAMNYSPNPPSRDSGATIIADHYRPILMAGDRARFLD
jgi:hypothetical protein